MNARLACDNCGSQPCMCQEFECPVCEGHGEVDRQHLRPQMVECATCKGAGSLKCDGPTTKTCECRWQSVLSEFDLGCRCEAAWERQQEDWASEPPPSARERQEMAQRERDALRSGVSL